MLSSVQIDPALKYGDNKKIDGSKYLISFFSSLYFIFRLSPTKIGIRRNKCRLNNLNISSVINNFLKMII